MTDTQVTWLTQESHDRLKTELDHLIANRPVIAAEINDRREEGDLAEVHQAAARLAEARLRQPARAQASPWRARVDPCRRDRHGPDG